MHISYRAPARFPHVARAQDRRPSWCSTNYITTSSRLPIIKCSFTCNVCACACVSRAAYTLTSRDTWNGKLRVRVMNSTWVTTRFSSHARGRVFRAVVTSGDVGGSSAWFWVGSSIFGLRSYTTDRDFQAWSIARAHDPVGMAHDLCHQFPASAVLHVNREFAILRILKAKDIPFLPFLLINFFYLFYVSQKGWVFLHQWLIIMLIKQ